MKNLKEKLKKPTKSNGYILVPVIVILSVILFLTYFIIDNLISELAISFNQKGASISFNLAEAGVQEAIWRIQNNSTTKSTFLNTTNGVTSFSHPNALVSNGSYSVTIQNTARAAANITSTGLFQMGNKTAQRKIIVKVTKAATPPPYNYDGAIFTGGSTGEEDITINNATLNVTGSRLVDDDNDPQTPEVSQPWGSLLGNRDIWFTDSTVNVSKDILANRQVRNIDSSITAGGTVNDYAGQNFDMPAIDISSSSASSYKSLAQAQNHYYTNSQFQNLLDANNVSLTGIVYIAGSQGIVIKDNRSLTINGMIVSEGSIDIGSSNKKGTLTINHIDGQPSGVITLSKLTVWDNGTFNASGLIYIGDRFSFDPYDTKNPSTATINLIGGILCRRIDGNGPRTLNINFSQDYINEGLIANSNETPVIQTQHWEEEY